jgi:hypothetical protein
VSSATVSVRVLPSRTLTLADGESSVLHVTGAELDLPAEEGKELVAKSFVEQVVRRVNIRWV